MVDFDRLVSRHKDAIYRQMIRTCGNREDAEDVLVEALLAAYRHADQLRDEGAFRGWVSTIGRRVCGHVRKKESIREILLVDDMEAYLDPTDDAHSMAERDQLETCVKGALGELSDIYRVVYELRDLDGKSNEETAESLGLSVPAVKSRLHRARSMVREALDRSVCREAFSEGATQV